MRRAWRIGRSLEEGRRFRQVLTPATLHNLVAVTQAIGGSSNVVLHLAALATELGYTLAFDDWERIGRETPLIANLKPASPHTVSDSGARRRRTRSAKSARAAARLAWTHRLRGHT